MLQKEKNTLYILATRSLQPFDSVALIFVRTFHDLIRLWNWRIQEAEDYDVEDIKKMKKSRRWRNQEDEVLCVVVGNVKHICKCTFNSIARLHREHIESQFLSQLCNRIFIHTWASRTNQRCPWTGEVSPVPEMKNMNEWSAASITEFQFIVMWYEYLARSIVFTSV